MAHNNPKDRYYSAVERRLNSVELDVRTDMLASAYYHGHGLGWGNTPAEVRAGHGIRGADHSYDERIGVLHINAIGAGLFRRALVGRYTRREDRIVPLSRQSILRYCQARKSTDYFIECVHSRTRERLYDNWRWCLEHLIGDPKLNGSRSGDLLHEAVAQRIALTGYEHSLYFACLEPLVVPHDPDYTVQVNAHDTLESLDTLEELAEMPWLIGDQRVRAINCERHRLHFEVTADQVRNWVLNPTMVAFSNMRIQCFSNPGSAMKHIVNILEGETS